MKVDKKTKQRLIRVRGLLEYKNGKRRSMEDVINHLVDEYEKSLGAEKK